MVLGEHIAALERDNHAVGHLGHCLLIGSATILLRDIHTRTQHGSLIERDVYRVSGDIVQIFILALYPIVKDIAQLERLSAKLTAGSSGVLLVNLKHSLLHLGTYLHNIVGALYVVETLPLDGH